MTVDCGRQRHFYPSWSPFANLCRLISLRICVGDSIFCYVSTVTERLSLSGEGWPRYPLDHFLKFNCLGSNLGHPKAIYKLLQHVVNVASRASSKLLQHAVNVASKSVFQVTSTCYQTCSTKDVVVRTSISTPPQPLIETTKITRNAQTHRPPATALATRHIRLTMMM